MPQPEAGRTTRPCRIGRPGPKFGTKWHAGDRNGPVMFRCHMRFHRYCRAHDWIASQSRVAMILFTGSDITRERRDNGNTGMTQSDSMVSSPSTSTARAIYSLLNAITRPRRYRYGRLLDTVQLWCRFDRRTCLLPQHGYTLQSTESRSLTLRASQHTMSDDLGVQFVIRDICGSLVVAAALVYQLQVDGYRC